MQLLLRWSIFTTWNLNLFIFYSSDWFWHVFWPETLRPQMVLTSSMSSSSILRKIHSNQQMFHSFYWYYHGFRIISHSVFQFHRDPHPNFDLDGCCRQPAIQKTFDPKDIQAVIWVRFQAFQAVYQLESTLLICEGQVPRNSTAFIIDHCPSTQQPPARWKRRRAGTNHILFWIKNTILFMLLFDFKRIPSPKHLNMTRYWDRTSDHDCRAAAERASH